MKFALFHTPFTRPDRTPRQAFDWAVRQAVDAEQAGFTEYWVGEHDTLRWEQIPSPELVLAAAAPQTERIKLCPGAHVLPYHDPATLATQTSWLSHITEGRYILGVAAGAYATDAALHGLADMSENYPKMLESLEIMDLVWRSEPFHFEGKYWSAGYPESAHEPMRDLRPYGGSMELAVAGLSMNSSSIRFAGSRGYTPMSFAAIDALVANHWEVYSTAAVEAGHTVHRDQHHVAREIFVADTDAEARKLALEGPIGLAWAEYVLPTYKQVGLFEMIGVDSNTVDLEWVADHWWTIGSPDTVAEKLQEAQAATGGWGTTLILGHDYIDDPAPWLHSMDLLANEVAPKVTLPGSA